MYAILCRTEILPERELILLLIHALRENNFCSFYSVVFVLYLQVFKNVVRVHVFGSVSPHPASDSALVSDKVSQTGSSGGTRHAFWFVSLSTCSGGDVNI